MRETFAPVPNVQLTEHMFVMDEANKQLTVENVVTRPDTPYGAG